MNEQQYNNLIYSGSQKMNIKEYKNLDVNNFNFEYTQKPDINVWSMENYSKNDEINESKNKVLVEENILSLEYLPEKDKEVIANYNAYSLTPYIIEDPFILNMKFNDKINIQFIIKIYININIINKI